MPKYRYLVVPLGVWVWWTAKGQIPTYLLTLPQQDGENVEGKNSHRLR